MRRGSSWQVHSIGKLYAAGGLGDANQGADTADVLRRCTCAVEVYDSQALKSRQLAAGGERAASPEIARRSSNERQDLCDWWAHVEPTCPD